MPAVLEYEPAETTATAEPPVECAKQNALLPEKDTFRILIMDSAVHVDVLKDACKDVGHEVVGAHSIDESFAFLNGEDHADLIICAAYLENESLFDFLKLLRQNPKHKKTMFMTLALAPGPMGTKVNASTEKAGTVLGSNVFLNMPVFDPTLLIAEIKKILPSVPSSTEAGSPLS